MVPQPGERAADQAQRFALTGRKTLARGRGRMPISPRVVSHPIHESSGDKLFTYSTCGCQIGRYGGNRGACSGTRGLARTGGGLKDRDFSAFKAAIKGLHELELNVVRGKRMVEILWRNCGGLHVGRHDGRAQIHSPRFVPD